MMDIKEQISGYELTDNDIKLLHKLDIDRTSREHDISLTMHLIKEAYERNECSKDKYLSYLKWGCFRKCYSSVNSKIEMLLKSDCPKEKSVAKEMIIKDLIESIEVRTEDNDYKRFLAISTLHSYRNIFNNSCFWFSLDREIKSHHINLFKDYEVIFWVIDLGNILPKEKMESCRMFKELITHYKRGSMKLESLSLIHNWLKQYHAYTYKYPDPLGWRDTYKLSGKEFTIIFDPSKIKKAYKYFAEIIGICKEFS